MRVTQVAYADTVFPSLDTMPGKALHGKERTYNSPQKVMECVPFVSVTELKKIYIYYREVGEFVDAGHAIISLHG